ncbi:hypothetical protein [Mucilaginibacter galii]|nr:hypothetical protein [Mucilaginibacter galii]
MQTSKSWISYFTMNARKQRVNWNLKPAITGRKLPPYCHPFKPGN